ncbi:MAG: 2-polyprenyl-3-methyl-5-hydroxy-6-metoxy-1,4-benzoquinol methylase [Halobacteriales archaeon]|jgi:2-polyprenyl-3-methyl-5-hydroxy-6-metoxy-1,4-benzoquinol methylase
MTAPDEARDRYFEANRDHWEALVEDVSVTTDDVGAFLDGETQLLPLERNELGEVEGKRLLHLQSLVGLRTLSWAREGATVTGVDFSGEAVEMARDLAAETGLADRATFLESNLYNLPDRHDERYDVVYTAFGVLCWLPDIERWAEIVAEFLEPGGTFYLAEIHPLADALDFEYEGGEESGGGSQLRIRTEHPYFTPEAPISSAGSDGTTDSGSDDDADSDNEDGGPYKWTHSLGETLTALLDAGIDLSFVHEHPFAALEQFPGMVEDENGYWRFEDDVDLPLTVTVKGTRR